MCVCVYARKIKRKGQQPANCCYSNKINWQYLGVKPGGIFHQAATPLPAKTRLHALGSSPKLSKVWRNSAVAVAREIEWIPSSPLPSEILGLGGKVLGTFPPKVKREEAVLAKLIGIMVAPQCFFFLLLLLLNARSVPNRSGVRSPVLVLVTEPKLRMRFAWRTMWSVAGLPIVLARQNGSSSFTLIPFH